jgi:hypothetical protein
MRNVRSSLCTVRVQSGPFSLWRHWCCDGAPCSVTLTIVRLQSSCASSAKLSGNHDGVFTRLPVSLQAAHVCCDTWRCLRSLLLFVWRNATSASRWWYILYLFESLVWGSYHVEWPATESVRVSIMRSVCQQRPNRLNDTTTLQVWTVND